MKKQFELVNKVLGVEKLEATDEGVFLNEDQLQAMETRLEKAGQDETAVTTANQAKTKAEEDLASANQAKTKAEEDLATANATIQQKDAEIAELQKNAGAEPSKVIAKKDPDPVTEKSGNVTDSKKSFMENLNAVSEEYL